MHARRAAMTLLAGIFLVSCGASPDDDYANRMAAEHEGDSPVASEFALAEPAQAVEATAVVYAEIDGNPVKGYLARPVANPEGAPGIIVIQEWWGLNDNIRAMARLLAGEGYAALAVDLYGGRVAANSGEARQLMTEAMEHTTELEDNLSQAYDYLTEDVGAPRVGTIGWCFGGGWSLRAGLLFPNEIDAVVIYYGQLVDNRDQLATLEMPILGFFGAEDKGIPVEGVRAFEKTLGELGKDVRIQVYEGANHAFANPSGERYNAEAAEDAWGRTLEFLGERLRGGEG